MGHLSVPFQLFFLIFGTDKSVPYKTNHLGTDKSVPYKTNHFGTDKSVPYKIEIKSYFQKKD